MSLATVRDFARELVGHWRASVAATPAPVQGGAFVQDANALLINQDPTRARLVLKCFWGVLAVFLAWAALTKIDEVTKGDGKVISSTQLQVMQSLDGGVVSEILVKEGELVQPGQALLNIDPTRFDSSLQENRAQYLALVARAARLRALADGAAFDPPPDVVKD